MRLRTFHRSATTGNKGHAGGITYHGMFGPYVDDLSIQVHVRDPNGAERYCSSQGLEAEMSYWIAEPRVPERERKH